MTIYRLTDRLHHDRTVQVAENEIVPTLSAWLAEVGASSPLVEQLGHAVRVGDWPAAHDIAHYLSVEVSVAA